MASAKAPPLAAAVASAQRRRDEATPFLVSKDATASPWSRFPRAAKGVCAFLNQFLPLKGIPDDWVADDVLRNQTHRCDISAGT